MKTIVAFLCLILAITANAQPAGAQPPQQSERKYTFKEVGWSIVLPEGFIPMTKEQEAANNERGKKALEKTLDAELDVSAMKNLISATRNKFNYFNSTITPFDPKTDGDYKEVSKEVKKMLYLTFAEQMPGAKIDSATSSATIDGLKFDKFSVSASVNGKVVFTSILLSRLYKGYDFGINYLYLDEKTKADLEEMLRNSKFTK